MKKKFNNKKYIKEIKKNGYCIIPNFFSNKSIKKMRNSLLDGLHYIKPDNEKDLQKKYLQIKKYNKILSGHWYDITKQDINLSQEIHKTEIIQLVKDFFKTDVVFSGRLSLHIIEDTNARLLQPHQEDKQLARDFFYCGLLYLILIVKTVAFPFLKAHINMNIFITLINYIKCPTNAHNVMLHPQNYLQKTFLIK